MTQPAKENDEVSDATEKDLPGSFEMAAFLASNLCNLFLIYSILLGIILVQHAIFVENYPAIYANT